MKITYVASPGSAQQTDTYYTLKKLSPDAGSTSIADLSTDNYPADRFPLKDPHGYDLPNPANQVIFKNQPVSWWIAGINAGSIMYTPISNTVNWSYIDGTNKYHILMEISCFIIPDRTDTVENDSDTYMTTVVLKENGVFNMKQTYAIPGTYKAPTGP
jgi:hypothetical protein